MASLQGPLRNIPRKKRNPRKHKSKGIIGVVDGIVPLKTGTGPSKARSGRGLLRARKLLLPPPGRTEEDEVNVGSSEHQTKFRTRFRTKFRKNEFTKLRTKLRRVKIKSKNRLKIKYFEVQDQV